MRARALMPRSRRAPGDSLANVRIAAARATGFSGGTTTPVSPMSATVFSSRDLTVRAPESGPSLLQGRHNIYAAEHDQLLAIALVGRSPLGVEQLEIGDEQSIAAAHL